MLLKNPNGFGVILSGFLMLSSYAAHSEEPFKLAMPVDCQLGVDCFLQNYADLDPSDAVRDPYCGLAAYDGHKGTDFRLRTFKDIDRKVPVLAAAEGTVIAIRDGVPDHLIDGDHDHAAVEGKECGNGVVIRHRDGFETQYCHLKRGSIAVQKGNKIKAGHVLGHIGSSGLSQFPHLHLSLRKNGQWIDPITGSPPGGQCGISTADTTFFQKDVFKTLPLDPTTILNVGFTEQVPVHEGFVRGDVLPPISRSSGAVIGWAWIINLKEGDAVRIIVEGPDGIIANHTSDPIARHKANYSNYAGKRLKPKPGMYTLTAIILRNGNIVETKSHSVIVK